MLKNLLIFSDEAQTELLGLLTYVKKLIYILFYSLPPLIPTKTSDGIFCKCSASRLELFLRLLQTILGWVTSVNFRFKVTVRSKVKVVQLCKK